MSGWVGGWVEEHVRSERLSARKRPVLGSRTMAVVTCLWGLRLGGEEKEEEEEVWAWADILCLLPLLGMDDTNASARETTLTSRRRRIRRRWWWWWCAMAGAWEGGGMYQDGLEGEEGGGRLTWEVLCLSCLLRAQAPRWFARRACLEGWGTSVRWLCVGWGVRLLC